MIASLAACQPSASNAVELGQSPAGLEQVQLTVTTNGQAHRFTVEVAKTPEQQAMGLMYRNRLAPDRGMIFPLDPPRSASFWMRNTLIPLDIIFVRADGSIANIAVNTVPYSEEAVLSEGPVAAVFEIAGGRSTELGIKPGDKVEW
jgi:uncharacterized membrane protein (UPF0127 family)